MTTWSAPLAWARAAFSSVETTPMTVAPRDLIHWQRIRPTPPAAAWTTTVSPALTLVGAADEVLRGHALEHHRGCGVEVDGVGEMDQAVRGDDAGGGVGADRAAGIGDAVAGFDGGDVVADGHDGAGAFHAGGGGEGGFIEAGAEIDVDIVEADGGVFDEGFAGTGVRRGDVLPFHHLRAAGRVEADGLAHDACIRLDCVRLGISNWPGMSISLVPFG